MGCHTDDSTGPDLMDEQARMKSRSKNTGKVFMNSRAICIYMYGKPNVLIIVIIFRMPK